MLAKALGTIGPQRLCIIITSAGLTPQVSITVSYLTRWNLDSEVLSVFTALQARLSCVWHGTLWQCCRHAVSCHSSVPSTRHTSDDR